MYGVGCYFSTTSNYAMSYSKGPRDKFVILAKVVTGRYQLGNQSTQRRHLQRRCHSTVDNQSNPTIFVVYHDASAYPEYVIKYN